MKTPVFPHRFSHLTARLQRRPHWGVALSVLLALLPWLTAFSPAEGEPAAASAPTIDATWRHYAGTEIQFAYPPGWTVEADEVDGEAGYRLVAPDQRLQIRLAAAPLDASATLHAVERRLVHTLERDDALARAFMRIAPAKRLAGHALAAVTYTATLGRR